MSNNHWTVLYTIMNHIIFLVCVQIMQTTINHSVRVIYYVLGFSIYFLASIILSDGLLTSLWAIWPWACLQLESSMSGKVSKDHQLKSSWCHCYLPKVQVPNSRSSKLNAWSKKFPNLLSHQGPPELAVTTTSTRRQQSNSLKLLRIHYLP